MSPKPIRSQAVRLASLLALGAALGAGCRGIGPATVARDRYAYSDAISESWKRQMLLNIVKLRYLDPPVFVDVGQIVAGYSLETGVNLGGQVASAAAVQGDSLALGGQAKYTDRPTITYTPLTGNKFVKALMTPLPPEGVFFMIQSGWPADAILIAAAASINGLKNQVTAADGVLTADPAFLRVLQLFRGLQRSGAVGLGIRQDVGRQGTTVMTFRSAGIDEQTVAQGRELRQLMKLDPDANEFQLVFGGTAVNDREIAVLTRSVLQVMGTMATQVDVPAEDIEQGRAYPGVEADDGISSPHRLVRIQSSESEPSDASVAVFYRDCWFWIDDRDLKSKRAFSFMLMLLTLSDTGQKEDLPMITIPAQ